MKRNSLGICQVVLTVALLLVLMPARPLASQDQTAPAAPYSALSAAMGDLPLVAHLGGIADPVATWGGLAYVGFGAELAIVDVSTPAEPRRIGHLVLEYTPDEIHVQYPYAYIASSGGLHIVDVSDPESPQLRGSLDMPSTGQFVGLHVVGDFAYFVQYNGPNNLTIIDVTNPDDPTPRGTAVASNAKDVWVTGDYAYIAGRDRFYVVRVEDPDAPQPVGQLYTGSVQLPSSGVQVAYPDAFLITKVGFTVVSVLDPANPSVKASIQADGWSRPTIHGNYAYATFRYGLGRLQFAVIDIGDTNAPELVGSCPWPADSALTRIAVEGSHAYATARHAGLRVIDIEPPTAPEEVGALDTFYLANDVALEGWYAYIADTWEGLQVIDASDLSNPVLVGQGGSSTRGHRLAVQKGFAYVLDYTQPTTDTLTIVDVRNPRQPQTRGSYLSLSALQKVVSVSYSVDHGPVAALWTAEELLLISVENPDNPVLLASSTVALDPRDAHFDWPYIYVADDTKGLVILDVSEPTAPHEVGSYADVAPAYGIEVSGDTAYVERDGSVWLIDISDRENPSLRTYIGGWKRLALTGDKLYVGYIYGDTRRLGLFDVSDPDHPQRLAQIADCEGLLMAASGNFLFMVPGDLYIREYVEEQRLVLTGLEVTQAIQNLYNDVMLIDGKRTFVRAHVQSTAGTILGAKARLIGRRNGEPLPGSPLALANKGGRINVYDGDSPPRREETDESFLFELPDSWCSGTVELEVVGDVTGSVECQEVAGVDNDCKVEVTFVETPDPEIWLIGYKWRNLLGQVHAPVKEDYDAVMSNILAQYPIHGIQGGPLCELEYSGLGAPLPETVGEHLLKVRELDGCGQLRNCIYYGLLVDQPALYLGHDGAGLQPGSVSVGWYDQEDPSTASHEIGHNLGISHTLCSGNEPNSDDSYPYDDGHISEFDVGDSAYFGFNIDTREIYMPWAGDLMSYCEPRWVSDWTYEHLQMATEERFGVARASVAATLLLAAGKPAVLISGRVLLEAGSGSLSTVLPVESPSAVSAPEPGAYAIRFLDAGDGLIAEYAFGPEQVVDTDEPTGLFAMLLPWPTGVHEVALVHGEAVLDSRHASTHVPVVHVTSPNGGELWDGASATVAWTASDEDGDTLEYTVQYSGDAGATWLTLATGWPSTSYEVGPEHLPGSDQALLRVLASDGFSSAQDDSDGTFTVATHGPVATVEAPESSAICVEQQQFIFSGSAYDAEDGHLDGTALEWQSNVDGVLGSGESLDVRCTDLAEGLHTITLTARDSDGETGVAEIEVEVYREWPGTPPVLGTVAPAGQTIKAGVTNAFTTTYSDPNGYADLDWCQFVIGSSTALSNTVYLTYDQTTDRLYLRNDADSAWLGGYAPGSAYTMANSQASLDCSQSQVLKSGDTITVTWAIQFQSTYTGTQTLYLKATDLFGSTTEWEEKGAVVVAPGLDGDLDADCDVDIVDIMLVASRWGTVAGDARYDPRYDLDGDGDIDIVDIMRVASRWGTSCGSF